MDQDSSCGETFYCFSTSKHKYVLCQNKIKSPDASGEMIKNKANEGALVWENSAFCGPAGQPSGPQIADFLLHQVQRAR